MLLESLQRQSGLSRSRLIYLAETSSKRYKVYSIEKRTGGHRTICHPSKQIKAIQRWLNKTLFKTFPVHEHATAYKKEASIRENAARHLGSLFTLRMDFVEFFPSFSQDGIKSVIIEENRKRELGLSVEDVEFVSNVVTRNEFLTIGAPSSPMISNFMMFDFDELVSEMALEKELIYSRYADDLFISAFRPNGLDGVAEAVEEAAQDYEHASLRVNRRKTAYLSRRYRRTITGLIVTPDHRVSIGRERKREIKSLVHRFSSGNLGSEEVSRLRGLIAFAMDAEYVFFESLCKKYGESILNEILNRNSRQYESE